MYGQELNYLHICNLIFFYIFYQSLTKDANFKFKAGNVLSAYRPSVVFEIVAERIDYFQSNNSNMKTNIHHFHRRSYFVSWLRVCLFVCLSVFSAAQRNHVFLIFIHGLWRCGYIVFIHFRKPAVPYPLSFPLCAHEFFISTLYNKAGFPSCFQVKSSQCVYI